MMYDDKLRFFLQRKRCLITGGTGLIGRQIAQLLLSLGSTVRVVSLDDVVIDDAVEHIRGDLTDFSFCLDVTAGFDCIFHVAGIKGSVEVTKARPASFLVPLLMFNTNVLEAAKRNKVDRLVYTSSIGAYANAEQFLETENRDGPPMDMYPRLGKAHGGTANCRISRAVRTRLVNRKTV